MRTLTRRELNRALIERQMLSYRHSVSAADAIESLVGMQAQAPAPPYIGLWTRLAGFQPEELASLLTGRGVVRTALMRGTIHLVTADDCIEFRALFQPLLDQGLKSVPRFRRAIDGIPPQDLMAASRAALAGEPLTPAELGTRLAGTWPDRDPEGLAYAARNLLALVQVPPRGVWGRGGKTRYATAEDWLGRPLAKTAAAGALVQRYLAAYGPATVADIRAWSGLVGLREVVSEMRPQLRAFRDENGAELLDVPGAPLPAGDTPVPVRFLPDFDSVLLAHADRTRVISSERFARIFTRNGIVRSTFMIDGFVHGQWSIGTARDAVNLLVEPFEPIPSAAEESLRREGEKLLAFVRGGVNSWDITIAPASLCSRSGPWQCRKVKRQDERS